MAKPRKLPWVGLVSLAKNKLAGLAYELGAKFPPPYKRTKRLGEVGRADAT